MQISNTNTSTLLPFEQTTDTSSQHATEWEKEKERELLQAQTHTKSNPSKKKKSMEVAPLRQGRQMETYGPGRKLYGLSYPPMPDLVINEKGVHKLLNQLNPSKAARPDEIPARLLKNLSEALSPAITALLRQLVQLGVLVDVWKQVWISPIFKKGDCNYPANYRPVSLTCFLCKCLEHILSTRIRRHLGLHGVLTPANHGFCSKHSYKTQLLLTKMKFSSNMTRGNR